MKKNIIYLTGILIVSLAAVSCKKESNGSGTKAVFSYVADGFNVNFTNFSTNATEYKWDFGDGSGVTSTLRAPQHVFTKKGDFLVSLVAKNGTDSSRFVDTVSIIGPNIKIDGDFTDWQYVSYTYENPVTFASSMRAIKTFASSDMVNFYLEGNDDMNMAIMDLYIDADNNGATGYIVGAYPAGSGADNLCEGSPVGGWGDVFTHSGAPTAFSWTPVFSFGDVMNFSALKTSGGKKVIEFSIKKSTFGANKKFINFCIIESTSGWAEVGKIPEAQAPASKFITVEL